MMVGCKCFNERRKPLKELAEMQTPGSGASSDKANHEEEAKQGNVHPFVRLPKHHRIALLTDGYSTPFLAKTAINLIRYRPQDIVGVIDAAAAPAMASQLLGVGEHVPVVAGLGDLSSVDAVYVGIAPPGGKLPESWRPIVCEAISRKIDVVSGLHEFLTDDAQYVQLAQGSGSGLYDVRRNRFKETAVGGGFRDGCVRIHTVGHDCSIGKMVVAVEVERGLLARGHDAKFLATGQTGIMISGDGVPIDCVVSDFVNGAAEDLVARHQQHDYLLVEGQGSISHPAFSAVTAGLLHGCAPDGLIFCYEAGRTMVKGFHNIPIADLRKQMEVLQLFANLRHPCRLIGIGINTRNLDPAAATAEVQRAEQEYGLPACDVLRDGADKLVNATIRLREELIRR
jgi:uncharacterized NAD-dependent epimerase/dehydratase family protein